MTKLRFFHGNRQDLPFHFPLALLCLSGGALMLLFAGYNSKALPVTWADALLVAFLFAVFCWSFAAQVANWHSEMKGGEQ